MSVIWPTELHQWLYFWLSPLSPTCTHLLPGDHHNSYHGRCWGTPAGPGTPSLDMGQEIRVALDKELDNTTRLLKGTRRDSVCVSVGQCEELSNVLFFGGVVFFFFLTRCLAEITTARYTYMHNEHTDIHTLPHTHERAHTPTHTHWRTHSNTRTALAYIHRLTHIRARTHTDTRTPSHTHKRAHTLHWHMHGCTASKDRVCRGWYLFVCFRFVKDNVCGKFAQFFVLSILKVHC